jgi:hypothetical protein
MPNNRNIDPDYINNRIDGHPQRPNNNILPSQRNLYLSQKIWGRSDTDVTLQHHVNTNIVTSVIRVASLVKFTKDLYNQNFSTGVIDFIAYQKNSRIY